MNAREVVALLDRPTSKSLGMVGLVVAQDGRAVETEGVIGSQRGRLGPHELDEALQAGFATRVDGPALDVSIPEAAALWVGCEFEERSARLGLVLPPLPPRTSGKTPEGRFWVDGAHHVWRVIDSWLAIAFQRVVETESADVAELMSWAMPFRTESKAARFLTARNGTERERDLEWWTRLSNDQREGGTSEKLREELIGAIERVRNRQPTTVLGFAAPARGGDKEIAGYLARTRSVVTVSFGGWLKQLALQHDSTVDRIVLQHLGQKIIDERGALALCLEVLTHVPEPLPEQQFLIEGIRHREVLDALLSLVGPSRFELAFVDRPESERRALLHAEGLTDAEVGQVLSDATEREVPALKSRAKFVLDGRRTESEAKKLLPELVG